MVLLTLDVVERGRRAQRELDVVGAQLRLIPCTRSELRATTDQVAAALSEHGAAPRLFAYPAQSNFSGVQHPLAWIELAHNHGWQVVLDAAAYIPTNPLDLSAHRPDFVAVSVYKLFGWPTGIGALLARGDALAVLRRPWFAGGTVKMASTSVHVQAPGHEGFEDGTVNYAAMPGVVIGLDYLRKVGIETIHTRTRCLTGWLLCRLGAMRHTNGQPLAQIYGPTTTECRGPTVAFNFLTPDREVVDERIIDARLLRGGSRCARDVSATPAVERPPSRWTRPPLPPRPTSTRAPTSTTTWTCLECPALERCGSRSASRPIWPTWRRFYARPTTSATRITQLTG